MGLLPARRGLQPVPQARLARDPGRGLRVPGRGHGPQRAQPLRRDPRARLRVLAPRRRGLHHGRPGLRRALAEPGPASLRPPRGVPPVRVRRRGVPLRCDLGVHRLEQVRVRAASPGWLRRRGEPVSRDTPPHEEHPSEEEEDERSSWAVPCADVLARLSVEPARGLSEGEVEARRERFGPNRLREAAQRSPGQILLDQFRSLVVLLLLGAALLSAAFGQVVEGVAIGAALLINAAIGFVTELKALRAVAALRELSTATSRVRRAGREQELASEALVPGDIVLLEAGDVVPADLRLVEVEELQADESTLTGESLPVDKAARPVPQDTPLAERTSMVYEGTSLARGAAVGVVVATGMRTELGRIAELVEQAEEHATPMERRLEALGRRLMWLSLAIGLVMAVVGITAGVEPFLMVETAIVLAIAAVPEGLPIVATIALARGTWQMSQRNALVNRLEAVETLGSISVILSDKTGTLTENRMVAARARTSAGERSLA
ncbi:MAG TPA: hypothetical protein DEA08_07075, partial [Planctomycetes bacterium]|nr:hypothetical protein [Planctomycetota bacterium]